MISLISVKVIQKTSTGNQLFLAQTPFPYFQKTQITLKVHINYQYLTHVHVNFESGSILSESLKKYPIPTLKFSLKKNT